MYGCEKPEGDNFYQIPGTKRVKVKRVPASKGDYSGHLTFIITPKCHILPLLRKKVRFFYVEVRVLGAI